jgi:hypothetical protein
LIEDHLFYSFKSLLLVMTSTNSISSSSTPVAIEAVPGLSVCTEFFSTAVETSLYFDPLLFEHSPAEMERQIQERKEQGERSSSVS